MEPTIFLFDVDGVLVKPGGYRAAVRATVNYFTRQLNLGELAPSDETVAIFEAQGITCEWDMVPLLLAMTLEAAAKRLGAHPVWDTFQSASDWLRANPQPPLAIDFAPQIRALGQFVQPGVAPSDSILAACLDNHDSAPFPLLAAQGVLATQGVLGELLRNTRRLELSRTTHVFETFALGDAAYSRATGLPVEVQTDAMLALHDQPLLAPDLRDQLRHMTDQHGLRVCAYTARPSLPDHKPDALLAVYAPEAEMALELVGWPELPLVGSGQTGEASRLLNEHEERLIKPSPYHAIAAAATAWTGDRPAALEWMRRVFCHIERGEPVPPLDSTVLPAGLCLHIFEDSPAGMRGGLAAVHLLEALGLPVSLHLWGISSHVEKAAALRAVGAVVYADINQAVSAALNGLSDQVV